MSLVLTWAHRDRITQADQPVDCLAATIGPEPGVHYALQVRNASNVLLAEKLDIDGATATVSSDAAGTLSFKLWSIRDGYASWQAVEWTRAQATPDAVAGTFITAATWLPPTTGPTQPHGEALVASGISPPVQLTNTGGTDFVFSS